MHYGGELHRPVKKFRPRHGYLERAVDVGQDKKKDKVMHEEVLTGFKCKHPMVKSIGQLHKVKSTGELHHQKSLG